MNLQQVKPGFVLTLPQEMWAQSETQVRAKPGEIIDIDVPGEAELIAGQLHKLQPAPEGSVPTPSAVKVPRIALFLRNAAAKAAPKPEKKAVVAKAPAKPKAAKKAAAPKPAAARKAAPETPCRWPPTSFASTAG